MRIIIAIYTLAVALVILSMNGCSIPQPKPEIKVVEVQREYPLCTLLEREESKVEPRPNMQDDDEEFILYLLDLVEEYSIKASYRLEHNNACVNSINEVKK